MKQSRSMFYTRKHRYLLESAPVAGDTSDRHCSFHPWLSPCHTMLRTFASTPRCCAARSKRRARSGRPALSAASMAALRTASNGDFLQLVVDQQRPIRQRHNFESFMIPGLFFEDLMAMSCKKCCSQSVNDSNYVHHPDAFSFGRNGGISSFPSSTCQASYACVLFVDHLTFWWNEFQINGCLVSKKSSK